jgi:hypothetical protein
VRTGAWGQWRDDDPQRFDTALSTPEHEASLTDRDIHAEGDRRRN